MRLRESLEHNRDAFRRLILSNLACVWARSVPQGAPGRACLIWGPSMSLQTEPLICRSYSPTWSSETGLELWGINGKQRQGLYSLRAPLQYCCNLKHFILIASCLQDPLCFLELEPPFVSGPRAPVSYNFPCMCTYSSWKSSAEDISTHESGTCRIPGGPGLQGCSRPISPGVSCVIWNKNNLILKQKVQPQVDRASATLTFPALWEKL